MPHDLSSRLLLESQLRASEARWRSIIDSAVDGIVVIDRHGRIEAFNPAAQRLFGYAEADVIGQNVNMLMPSPFHEEHDTYLSRYVATGHAKIIGTGRDVIGLKKDGTTFPVHLSVGEFTDAGERRFTGILHDLSARVQIEEQLRERTALARLGEMAAVIAHEVKNPLAGIRGAVQVMSKKMDAGGTEAAVAKEIIARIDALDAMMGELLLFARPPQPRLVPTELLRLVAAVTGLLREDPIFRDVQIEVRGECPEVIADGEMLKIVLHNLLLNAAHAVHGHGGIVIALDSDDSSCWIAVSDTGPGIPLEVRSKIFTPFFTTKARGTGLGLATSRRLLQAQQGDLSLECPPAGGTTMTIRLPVNAQ